MSVSEARVWKQSLKENVENKTMCSFCVKLQRNWLLLWRLGTQKGLSQTCWPCWRVCTSSALHTANISYTTIIKNEFTQFSQTMKGLWKILKSARRSKRKNIGGRQHSWEILKWWWVLDHSNMASWLFKSSRSYRSNVISLYIKNSLLPVVSENVCTDAFAFQKFILRVSGPVWWANCLCQSWIKTMIKADISSNNSKYWEVPLITNPAEMCIIAI